MVKYNLNYHMYIKLTDYGKNLIINKYGHSYFKACVESCKQDNGYYRLQCHEIMRYFGEYLYNGCKMPLEPTVYLEESELEKS